MHTHAWKVLPNAHAHTTATNDTSNMHMHVLETLITVNGKINNQTLAH